MRIILTIVAGVVIVVSFFTFYNIFLVNRSLQTLRMATLMTENTGFVGDLSGVDALMDQELVRTLTSRTYSSERVAQLSFIAGVLSGSSEGREVSDVSATLTQVVNRQEQKQSGLMNALDRLILIVGGPGQKVQAVGDVISSDENILLAKAEQLRADGDWVGAVGTLRGLVERYSASPRVPRYLARLGFIHVEAGQIEAAREVADQLKRYRGDAVTALLSKGLMEQIRSTDGMLSKRDELQRQLPLVEAGEPLQRAYFELAQADLLLRDYASARKHYQRAASEAPGTAFADRARFLEAMSYKIQGQLRACEERLVALLEEGQARTLEPDIHLQLVDLARRLHGPQAAAERLQSFVQQYREHPLRGLAQQQLFSVLSYDLRDVNQASDVLAQIESDLPPGMTAQNFGRWREKITGQRAPKDSTTIIDRLLDTAVGRYRARLQEYVRRLAVGDYKEVRREYTSSEFTDFVRRRFATSLPPQIQNIQVSFEPELFQCEGTVRVAGIITLQAWGRLKPKVEKGVERHFVQFELLDYDFGWVKIPRVIMDALMKKFNEAMVEENFPLDIVEVTAEMGRVKVHVIRPGPKTEALATGTNA